MLPQKQMEKQNAEGNSLSTPQDVPVLEYLFNVAVPNTNEKLKCLLNIFIYSGIHNNKITKLQENESEIFQNVFFLYNNNLIFKKFELVYYKLSFRRDH